jgi:hypothetical protein
METIFSIVGTETSLLIFLSCCRLGGVFDGGRLGATPLARLGSTVADLSEPGTYRIVRPGSALGTNSCGVV